MRSCPSGRPPRGSVPRSRRGLRPCPCSCLLTLSRMLSWMRWSCECLRRVGGAGARAGPAVPGLLGEVDDELLERDGGALQSRLPRRGQLVIAERAEHCGRGDAAERLPVQELAAGGEAVDLVRVPGERDGLAAQVVGR